MKIEGYEEICNVCRGTGILFQTNDICCNCIVCNGTGKVDWIDKIKYNDIIQIFRNDICEKN